MVTSKFYNDTETCAEDQSTAAEGAPGEGSDNLQPEDMPKGFLYEPVASAVDLPLEISDPLDEGIPRVRTTKTVIEHGAVEKQLMVLGSDQTPTDGSKCFIHLRSWQKDDPSEMMEDSRHEKEPLQIVLGNIERPHLKGVHVGVKSMRTGERCLLHVRSDYAYGAQGHFSFPHIPPSMDMVFDVELLGFDELDEEELPRAEMTFEERCRQADKRRIAGNELFKEGNIELAMAKYTMALSYFGESFMFQLEGLDKYRAHAQSIRLPVHLNLAACKLKKGAFQEVITLCDEVVKDEPENVKALFRRGCARRELGQDDAAEEDLTKAQGLAPTDAAIKAEIRKLKLNQREASKNAKSMYGGLFGDAPQAPQPATTWTGILGSALGYLMFWRRGSKQ